MTIMSLPPLWERAYGHCGPHLRPSSYCRGIDVRRRLDVTGFGRSDVAQATFQARGSGNRSPGGAQLLHLRRVFRPNATTLFPIAASLTESHSLAPALSIPNPFC